MMGTMRNEPVVLLAAVLLAAPLARASDTPNSAAAEVLDRDASVQLWKEKLGLTSEQARKLATADRERDSDAKPLREKLRDALLRLDTQLNDNKPEAEIADSLKVVEQLKRAVAEKEQRFDAGLASFLSPTQRARLVLWRTLGKGRVAATPAADGGEDALERE